MGIEVICEQCGKAEQVIPARARKYRFCSYSCRGNWRSENYLGSSNPNWKGGEQEITCLSCSKKFTDIPSSKRKFCSKACADKDGFRYSGKNHPNYREDARRKNRSGSHHKWANAVISRDNATCQDCGAKGIELHAHHIKSYRDFSELRFEVSNGITLCCKCHWKVHSACNDNGVNSGEVQTGSAVDNPEPSLGGNIREGATTNGRAYRRWEGNCHWCGDFISKRLSDVAGHNHVFCSKKCLGKHLAAFRTFRPTSMDIPSTAVIPTRAPCT